ncbi:MAG: aromatic acid/H+ symport family MFS transporter [Firmicutes bacterium]|nr:aromatic acid/H+ symport family MFS transporter [Bacillota bacterium]
MEKTMISEVIDDIGISKYTFKIYFLVGLVILFSGIVYMVVPYTMAQIASEWKLTKVQTGALSSWSLLGLMVGGILAGILSDRLGRKKALVFSSLVYSLLTLAIFWVQSYEAFAVLRILGGIGIGAAIPVGVTMMSENAPTKNRGFFSASIMSFYMAGWVIVGIMCTYVVPEFGWRLCYLLAGLSVFYPLVLVAMLSESPHWLLSKGRESDAINVIKSMEKNAKGTVNEWTAGSLSAPPPPKAVGLGAIFSSDYRKITINLWITYFMGSVVIYGITGWLPSLLVEEGYGVVQGYSFAILQNVFAIGGALATGYVADIIGRKKNVAFAWLFTAIFVLLLGYATNQWQVVIFSVLSGVAMHWGLSGVQPTLAESYQTDCRNTGVAWAQAFGRIGGFTGPIAAGFIQQLGVGFTGTFIFFAIPAVIFCVLAFLFFAETKGKRVESLAGAEA